MNPGAKSIPERVLAIGAHPDDIEFGCGATLAKWAAQGAVVHHLVLTDGSKGSWNVGADLDALVATRIDEQHAATRALGTTGEVVMLGNVDGELDATMATRAAVALVIRELRPQIVLGHDPWKRYRLHPDHRAAGWLTIDGVVAARDPHFFADQGLPHHRPSAIWLFEADEPDHAEDVTGFADFKVAALLEHRSQFKSTMGIGDQSEVEETAAFRRKVLDELAEAGQPAGVEHAEAFKVLDEI